MTDKITSVQIVKGLHVVAYRAKDGAFVLEIEGAPEGDPDCNNVRVYLNDGFAAEWVGPENPRYRLGVTG